METNNLKKYKLICEYPGSPKLGHIVEFPKDRDFKYYSQYPEYWEEVVEPDYEVTHVLYATEIRTLFNGEYRLHPEGIGFSVEYLLRNGGKIHSVKRLSDGEVFTVGNRINIGEEHQIMIRTISMINISSNGTLEIGHEWGSLNNCKDKGIFHRIKKTPLDYEILSYVKKDRPSCITTKKRGGTRHDEFWDIHSVKRLSDGEIFKVGDVVKTFKSGSNNRIKSISLAKGNDSLKQGIWLNYDYGGQHLSKTIKVKDKLFTTEDGVDVYDGHIYWFANNYELSSAHADLTSGKSSSIKYFSTKEAAEAYILNNKPCLSLDDIRRSLSLTTPQINELVTLIKTKL